MTERYLIEQWHHNFKFNIGQYISLYTLPDDNNQIRFNSEGMTQYRQRNLNVSQLSSLVPPNYYHHEEAWQRCHNFLFHCDPLRFTQVLKILVTHTFSSFLIRLFSSQAFVLSLSPPIGKVPKKLKASYHLRFPFVLQTVISLKAFS
jgi:hypothetical protein